MTDTGDLTLEVHERDDAVILAPVGEIDLSRAPALRLGLQQIMRKKPKRLVVDLSGVPYMDSSGVATFVEALQQARGGNCRLVLCALQQRVRSVFEIARLDMVFTIVPDVDGALSA